MTQILSCMLLQEEEKTFGGYENLLHWNVEILLLVHRSLIEYICKYDGMSLTYNFSKQPHSF